MDQKNQVLDTIKLKDQGRVVGVPTIETTGAPGNLTMTCVLDTFITNSCEDPDRAFEVLMALWSWEGAMRIRYGEFGVNWDYADEGAKSATGLDATYRLISDPLDQENTAHWGVMACCFNEYAAGETAQAPEQAPEQ